MSKQTSISRKVALDSPDRKPSVFERLGSKSCVISGKNVCRSWAQNGTCPLNKSCKFASTHVLCSPSKRSKTETMKKSISGHKKTKDEHKKSVRSHQSSEREWEGWELGDLEDADEKVLEKRKQELQRELQLHLKKEKELTRKKDKRIEKRRAASTSSSSTTTTESSSSSSSSSTSSSEPRKRLSRKRKHASSSSDSDESPHRRKKSPKTVKGKVTAVKKLVEKKDSKTVSENKNKSVVVAKKTTVQKKSYSPSWDKSRGKSPVKQQGSKKLSPNHSLESKSKTSPRYEKTVVKGKDRGFSPKQKETSPKRTMRKGKESSVHSKEKLRQSPSKTHKRSPSRSRRYEESSDKRRSHYEDRKHSPRRDRSRERDRKREVRRGRSHEGNNGGLKKGGKILPLKPSSYNRDSVSKKDASHHKSSEKSSDLKSKEDDHEKDRNRVDRDRDRSEKDKGKCDRDRSKHKRPSDEHDRRSARDKDSDRNPRGRDDRCRDRELERIRFNKEREAERQKERDEALERCRERQRERERERERIEKERKEKEDKKHQRDKPDNEPKEFERELPSLMDLKPENPRAHLDSSSGKSFDKHLPRDVRRNVEKESDKNMSQTREGRDRGTPEKSHDRRDVRRSVENERRLVDKDYDTRRNREGDIRNSSEMRRSVGDGRRGVDEDSRRPWDDVRRLMDPVHGRRSLDPINDRRQPPLVRRPGDDLYRRVREDMDVRDYALEERQRRKLMHNHPDWDTNDQNMDYRDAEMRDDWNHPDRHLDWNSRYDHNWRDHEESRESWNHYSRRPPLDDWNGDWAQERPMYPEDCLDMLNKDFPENTVKRINETEPVRLPELNKNKDVALNKEEVPSEQEKIQKEGDALSDISDDPDDILNQEDDPVPEATPTSNANVQNEATQPIYVRSNEFLFEKRRPLLECLGERSLDFEEISDEELEEEARVSKGIVDVLGADWAGLVQETRLKPKRFEGPGSAHRRWLMDNILLRYGISTKYAGQEFTEKLLLKYKSKEEKKENSADLCENKIKKENEEVNGTNTNEDMEISESKENILSNGVAEVKIKKEEEIMPKLERIPHSVAALNSAIRDTVRMKSNLFQSYNRFKRALSARTDLNLRRELCNLPSREPLHFTPPLESKLYETSVQLFYGNATAAV